jgi:octaprenyl-diphosphate synthase
VQELTSLGRVDLLAVLARAANEMSVGELRQLMSCDALRFTESDYYRLIASKTASLMSAACEMGAVAGDARFSSELASYGHDLGMAFQIADDLLDYTETAAVTGKPSGQDLREHKMTLPLIAAMQSMNAPAMRDVETFFADPEPSDDGIQHIIGLVRDHGGIEYALQQARNFGERAAHAADSLPASVATYALKDAVTYVVDRRN